MPKLLLATTLVSWLALIPAATAQISTTITDAEQRFYVLQPFYAAEAATRLKSHHIGIEVAQVEGHFVVSSLLDGYPALQAGVRRGDRILRANGAEFYPLGSFAIDGNSPAPQPVTLELARGNQQILLNMHTVYENYFDSRRTAALASIQEFAAGNKNIAYYHPWALSRNLNDLLSFMQMIASVAQSDGLILDLRDSYGFLSIHHLDAFLPTRRSLIAPTGTGNPHTNIEFNAVSFLSRHYGKPVAVLINSGTAGGPELLAYYLATLDRVTTIGETSAGELGVYELQRNAGAESLRYAAAVDTAIDGIPLTDFRVVPELQIEYPLSFTTRSDPQFEAAYNVLLGRI